MPSRSYMTPRSARSAAGALLRKYRNQRDLTPAGVALMAKLRWPDGDHQVSAKAVNMAENGGIHLVDPNVLGRIMELYLLDPGVIVLIDEYYQISRPSGTPRRRLPRNTHPSRRYATAMVAMRRK